MSTRLLLSLVALAALLVAGAVVLVERYSPDPDQHMAFEALVVARRAIDQDVARHALEARFAFSSSYDALAKDERDSARLRDQLQGQMPRFLLAGERQALLEGLRRYDAISAQRSGIVEHFKSQNALLRNSIGYFPRAVELSVAHAEHDHELRREIEELRSVTLALALHDDAQLELAQHRRLATIAALSQTRLALNQRRSLELMLAHARAIAERKVSTDRLLGTLLALPLEAERAKVKADYESAYARGQKQRHAFEYCVSALALLLFGVVAFVGVRLQRAAHSVSQANERLEAAVTARTAELQTEMQQRARIEIELRQAQKLEAVGQLASGIAHEINTPIQYVGDSLYFLNEASGDLLRLVQAYAKLAGELRAQGDARPSLREAQELAEEVNVEMLQQEMPEALERTADGAKQVASIVKAMKTFAHHSLDKAPLDLNAAIENTLIVSRNEYKYVADVETELAELPDVICNAGGVRQVLLNLIVNAAHAIADTGANADHRGSIHISTTVSTEHVVIRVTDTGGGIPEAIRERVFDPFFTTKEPGRGSGQGLAICQSIVAQHGGKLWFETELGRGTSFFVQLPFEPSERHDASPTTHAA